MNEKAGSYSIGTFDLNNTSLHIIVTRGRSKKSLKTPGRSDRTNLDKQLQTFRNKCDDECTKEKGMKMVNELFELDTRLGAAIEPEALPR